MLSVTFHWLSSFTVLVSIGLEFRYSVMNLSRSWFCLLREQQNTVENLRQGPAKSAADFLVRVSSAVGSLERDFKGTVPKEEFDTLLYDVSFNGVNEEIQHVLNSEMARYGKLNADLMYDAVKKHEVYMAHHQCLQAKPTQPSTTPTPAPHAPVGGHFKPRFQRPSARVAAAVEDLGPTPIDIEFETEGDVEEDSTDAPSGGSGGLFIPEFLEDFPDGGLTMKMAQAIKAEEEKQKKCFACQSPDHFIRDCPVAKNGRGPPQLRGTPKNKPAPAANKAKVVASLPTQQAQVVQPPPNPQRNAPAN